MELTEYQKHDLAVALNIGWRKYSELFGEPPHGTLQQMKALVELIHRPVAAALCQKT